MLASSASAQDEMRMRMLRRMRMTMMRFMHIQVGKNNPFVYKTMAVARLMQAMATS